MSFSETIFLFFLALIVFGPKKLPEIARQVGKMMNEFRRASNEFKAQIEQEIAQIEVQERKTILPPSPAPEGTASRALNAPANTAPSEASQSAPYPAGADSGQGKIAEVPAAATASSSSEDEPLFAAAGATGTAPASAQSTNEAAAENPAEAVTASTSQESHA